MNIVSLLYNKIQIVSLKKRFLKSNQVFCTSIKIPAKEAEAFNIDTWALYLKQALSKLSPKPIKGKLKLILGQNYWRFLQVELPSDITDSALFGFISQELEGKLAKKITGNYYKYLVYNYKGKKYAGVYLLTQETLNKLNTLFSFYDLKIEEIYPEALLVFSLFEHTLNQQKQEAALFLEYEQELSKGMLFNSTGLLAEKLIVLSSKDLTKDLKALKKSHSRPIARLILSGELSTKIRQDNFTKESTLWTNPLEKVLQNSPLVALAKKLNIEKLLLPYSKEIALIYLVQNKKNQELSLEIKKQRKSPSLPTIKLKRSLPKLPIKTALKILLLILVSSLLTYGLLTLGKWGLGNIKTTKIFPTATPTPAPKPTATPTPKVSRQDLEIEILNGTGKAGQASSLQEELEELGYNIGKIGNADNYDYQKTVIIAKNQAIYKLVKKDLEAFKISEPKFEQTNTDTTTIIFGADLILP